MSDRNRDMQFVGFASQVFEELKPEITLLCIELGRNNAQGIQQAEEIIKQQLARRAHDLVEHAIEASDYSSIQGWLQGTNIPLYHKVVQSIPDMPELPEEQAK